MLVVSRKGNEEIVIGRDIIVTVVEIRGDRVKLGIEAPRHMPVVRRAAADGGCRSKLQGAVRSE